MPRLDGLPVMAIVMVVINVAVFGRVFRRICVIRIYLCHCRCSLWWIEAGQSICHRMPITTLVSRFSPERRVDPKLIRLLDQEQIL
jgi:hypothetical protein